MNKITVWIIIVLVVILGFGFWFYWSGSSTLPSDSSNDMTAGSVSETVPTNTVTDNSAKEFIVTGKNFSFDPATIDVKKGDHVKITFKNNDGMHDLKINELAVATKRISGGEEGVVEFVADKVGAFEYYCSVGKHRQMGMKGVLTVSE